LNIDLRKQENARRSRCKIPRSNQRGHPAVADDREPRSGISEIGSPARLSVDRAWNVFTVDSGLRHRKPFVFEDGLHKLDVSLSDLIRIIEDEQGSVGASSKGSLYLEKFRSWKEELLRMRDPQSRLNVASEGGGGAS